MPWAYFFAGIAIGVVLAVGLASSIVGTILRRTVLGIERRMAHPLAESPCPCARCSIPEGVAVGIDFSRLPPCPRQRPQ